MSTQQIHQLQASYSPGEDRILLKFNTTGGVEFKFWLTRLFVKKFWPNLVNTMEVNVKQQTDSANNSSGAAPGLKDKVLGFMHQSAVENANFSTDYESSKLPCPLGDLPILVHKAGLHLRGVNSFTLSLHPEVGDGVELGVDQNLLHLLSKLIHDAVAQIDWGLVIQIPGVENDSSGSANEDENPQARRLH
ncbi:MAG: hypothetical protein HQL71_08890 [Magnetococcales bacterium]|nr:hypothetical protein [Magnetococcales bacterium]